MNRQQVLNAAARNEHELWQKICAQLKDLGAVTEADLRSRLREQDTAGQRLLGTLRAWGDARVELAKKEERQ